MGSRPGAGNRALVIGRIVHFETTSAYEVPAMIIGTKHTMEDLDPNLEILNANEVHLNVFDPDPESDIPNYRAWFVRHDPHGAEVTYHWPDECEE